MTSNWTALAFNQAPDAPNEIHGDKVAREFGFKGGLVLGAAIGAYITHPAVESWGKDFLSSGRAHVKIVSPLYDGEAFAVETTDLSPTRYRASLFRPDRTVSATAEVHLAEPEALAAPPALRGDPIGDKDTAAVAATPENMAVLKEKGCHASRFRWRDGHSLASYLKVSAEMPPLLRVGAYGNGFANMSFILGCSNVVLARAVHMNPWVLLETTSQNYAPIALDTRLIAELEVLEFYNKKGHEFVDARVNLFNADSGLCHCSIDKRAIYQLRGM